MMRRKISEVAEIILSKPSEEIECLDRKYDSFNLQKKINQCTGTERKKWNSIVKDEKRTRYPTSLKRSKDVRKILKKYLKTTGQNWIYYCGARRFSTKNSKYWKAVGPNKVRMKIIKLIENRNITFQQIFPCAYLESYHSNG